jgi:L-lysine 6-transaminase
MSTTATSSAALRPQDVHAALGKWMLADGMPLVLDLEKSRGARLHDARSGRTYLDFFGCFGSTPIGWNHPALLDAGWMKSITRAVANRPSNSDLYSVEMAQYVERMAEVARPEGFTRMFFVDGGALAVENAMKIAFDWKVRRNRAKGVDADVGQKILHFKKAFHGRSGYTMSVTNTRPDKVLYFPKFASWPRCEAPEVRFPLEGADLIAHAQAEQAALEQVDAAFAAHGDDIAAILIETIQCEGGDRHFRAEFLQGLQARCEKYDCLFLLDEVQTGFFTSGKAWAFEHYGVTPDVFVFGKKAQQCGLMAGPKVLEVPGNVFETSSRINSTLGGHLVDMMRATRVLEVIRDEQLAANAAARGAEWLRGMRSLQAKHDQISNARGLGLLLAFDLPDTARRDRMLLRMREHGLLGLVCGDRTLRFRPHLGITAAEVAEALDLTEKSL